MGISIIASKMHRYETFMPGCYVGICGIFEVGSWITILILVIFKEFTLISVSVLPLIIGILMLAIMNISNFVVYRNVIKLDDDYVNWLSLNHTHRACNLVMNIFGLIFSFKMTRLLFSKYFGFDFFKAKLSSIKVFFPWNIINGLSILLCSVPIFISSFAIAYNDTEKS